MTRPILNTSPPGQFGFGLSEAQEAHAAKLHRKSIVFDMLSQYGGGNIFAHYSQELKADFEARRSATSSSWQAFSVAREWPFEMSKLGKSDLLREWFQVAGLTCGTYNIPPSRRTRSNEPAGQSGVGTEGGLAGLEGYLRRQRVWFSHG